MAQIKDDVQVKKPAATNANKPPAEYWQLAAGQPYKPGPIANPFSNWNPEQATAFAKDNQKKYKAQQDQEEAASSGASGTMLNTFALTQPLIQPPSWMVQAGVNAVQNLGAQVGAWMNKPIGNLNAGQPFQQPQTNAPLQWWQRANNGYQQGITQPQTFTTAGKQPTSGITGLAPVGYGNNNPWTAKPARQPSPMNYNTSMSYPNYTGPKGPAPYDTFGQLQPVPGAPLIPAPATVAGKGTAYKAASYKRGGYGGGGYGGYSYDKGSAYKPSAWASLVGWNINR